MIIIRRPVLRLPDGSVYPRPQTLLATFSDVTLCSACVGFTGSGNAKIVSGTLNNAYTLTRGSSLATCAIYTYEENPITSFDIKWYMSQPVGVCNVEHFPTAERLLISVAAASPANATRVTAQIFATFTGIGSVAPFVFRTAFLTNCFPISASSEITACGSAYTPVLGSVGHGGSVTVECAS